MKNSFNNTETAIQQMKEGSEAHYMKFENSLGQVEGIALINMDNNCQQRAYIRHISVKNREKFTEVLQ